MNKDSVWVSFKSLQLSIKILSAPVLSIWFNDRKISNSQEYLIFKFTKLPRYGENAATKHYSLLLINYQSHGKKMGVDLILNFKTQGMSKAWEPPENLLKWNYFEFTISYFMSVATLSLLLLFVNQLSMLILQHKEHFYIGDIF